MRKKFVQYLGLAVAALMLTACASPKPVAVITPIETEETTTIIPTVEEPTTVEVTTEEVTTPEETMEEETTPEETMEEETTPEPTTPEPTTPEPTTPEPTTQAPTQAPVDVSDVPKYEDYSDYASFDNARDIYYSNLVETAKAEGRKVVYLTFDDGSGSLTPKVLDILDQYNVKATFFVVGEFTKDYSLYNEILQRGNSLGSHTINHARASIYQSLDGFKSGVDPMNALMKEKTGTTPYLFRFPGGSSTMYSNTEDMKNIFIPYLKSIGMTHFDWNVSSGDGTSGTTTEKVYSNVVEGVKKRAVSVVLMHDGYGHEATVAALPDILNTLLNKMNCLVVPITRSTTPVQHR